MHDVTHGVMFHHFCDAVHPPGQGALTGPEFEQMLDWLCDRYTLLDAPEYLQKAVRGQLQPREICLTFDDALLCQFEIAIPVMQRRGVQAFFFIYSSPLCGRADYLEVFRYFRLVAYAQVDAFYADFFALCDQQHPELVAAARQQYAPGTYLAAFPFYTPNDKWFRYLRDIPLGKARYELLMLQLMAQKGFDLSSILPRLWMNEEHLRQLQAMGHVIGLHSFSHPTMMHTLPADQQRQEYMQNLDHLKQVLKTPITAMSHPCGNYNDQTLVILRELGIELGFRSSMSRPEIATLLEIPREDHANLWREMHA